MSALIQIAALTEFLAPDFFWICLLTPVFFSMIGIAEAVGLFASEGSFRAFELSIFLAYLASIVLRTASASSEPLLSGAATSRNRCPRGYHRKVQDATE